MLQSIGVASSMFKSEHMNNLDVLFLFFDFECVQQLANLDFEN